MSKNNIGPYKIQNCFISTTKVNNAQLHEITNPLTGEVTDSYFIVRNSSQLFYDYSHFVYITNRDGSVWEDGNLFLRWKVETNPRISPSRMEFLASALSEFKTYCDRLDENGKLITDYKNPKGYNDTPTHRFHNYLEDTRTPSTGKRLMSAVSMFYEWMIKYNDFSTKFPLWESTTQTSKHGKNVEVKDVNQFRGVKTRDPNSKNHVNDGEVLRPLSKEEQKALDNAYSEIGNPEYKLVYWLSKESMARKQTILTLRLHHFIDSLPRSSSIIDVEEWYQSLKWPNDNEELNIMIGVGYDADSKRGLYESYSIHIHGWLWKRVIQYIASSRAFIRRSKALPQHNENFLKQYLFLTERGHPMYHAKNDRYYNNITLTGLKRIQEGGAMDKWIDETLKPRLRSMGYHFDWHFHDIRATGGANFLENQKDTYGDYSNEGAWRSAIKELMLRMNHSSLETTYGYLHHLEKKEKAPIAQANYEASILKDIQVFDIPKKKNE